VDAEVADVRLDSGLVDSSEFDQLKAKVNRGVFNIVLASVGTQSFAAGLRSVREPQGFRGLRGAIRSS